MMRNDDFNNDSMSVFEDEDNIAMEVVPLTSRLLARSASSGLSSTASANATTNNNGATTTTTTSGTTTTTTATAMFADRRWAPFGNGVGKAGGGGHLSRLSQLRRGRYSSSSVGIGGNSNNNNGAVAAQTVAEWKEERVVAVQQAITAVVIFMAGWWIPRVLIAHETGIAHKVPPYQVTAAGDVILDFALNFPLVDPPTIPCAYLRFCFVSCIV